MRKSLRAVLPAAAAAVVLLAAAPANAAPLVPFAADSGDACRRGVTEGTLDWNYDGPVIRPVVDVAGYLADSAGSSPCFPDALYSTATFTAYGGTVLIDREVRKADNARVSLAFALVDDAGVRRIDRVVVQVCRHTGTGIGFCGKAQEYRAP